MRFGDAQKNWNVFDQNIPKPVWAVGFAHEQTLRDATLAVFSFLILKQLQHTRK
jgi:hypothetical protein